MFENFDLLKGLKQCFRTKKHLFLYTPKIITYSWPQRGWLGGGSTLTVSLTVKYCFLAFYGQPILVHFQPLLIHLNLIWCKTPFLPLVPPWRKNSAQKYFKPSPINNKNLNNQPKSSPFSVRLIAFHTNTQLCLSQHGALTIFSFLDMYTMWHL